MYVRLPDDYKIGTISPEKTPTSPVTSTAELTADAEYSDGPATESLPVQPPQPESDDLDTSAALSQAMT